LGDKQYHDCGRRGADHSSPTEQATGTSGVTSKLIVMARSRSEELVVNLLLSGGADCDR
jgi:hypothetical protein